MHNVLLLIFDLNPFVCFSGKIYQRVWNMLSLISYERSWQMQEFGVNYVSILSSVRRMNTFIESVRILSSCDTINRRIIYAQKEAMGRGSAHRNNFFGRALVGVLTSVHLKTDPSSLLSAICLLACCLTNFGFVSVSCSKSAPSR